MRLKIFICLLLAGITLAIYWPVKNYGLIYYDDPLFLDNPEIQSGLNWHSLVWAFSSVMIANWHPITNLSFILDHQLFGANPGAEHFVNLLFHAANAALLFLVLNSMTKFPWRSAMVAAIFAWHPLRVESVVWISERKDVLFGFFLLLALWSYARFAELANNENPKSKKFYFLSLLIFALSLMSKAMAVTFPFLLLLLDFWPLNRFAVQNSKFKTQKFKRLFAEKIPFFALTAIFCVITFQVQKTHAAVVSLERVGWDERIGNCIVSYWRYLAKMFWPTDLAVIYPHPSSSFATAGQWPDWQIWIGAILLFAISALCVKWIFRKPYLAIGWFWFLGTMLPVVGLVQVGETAMADRYTYIPLIGPAISVIWWISEIWKEKILQKVFPGILIVVALAILSFLTHQQIRFWESTTNLFAHTIEATGINPSAQCGLACGFEHENADSKAMMHYRIALGIAPRYREAQYNLARLLAKNGHWQEAADNFSEIISDSPTDFEAQLGLANALAQLGRTTEFIEHLETAIQTAPDMTEALNNLAWTLATSTAANIRNGERAIQLAQHACELTHYEKTIYIGTLAAAYAEAGRFDDAIATAQKAVSLAGKNGEKGLLQKNQELLELYSAHKSYRDTSEKLAPAAQ